MFNLYVNWKDEGKFLFIAFLIALLIVSTIVFILWVLGLIEFLEKR